MSARAFDVVTTDPAVLGGKPCIRGMRISVSMIVQVVAAGKSIAQILEEYRYLEAADIREALAYSTDLADSEYYLPLQPSARTP